MWYETRIFRPKQPKTESIWNVWNRTVLSYDYIILPILNLTIAEIILGTDFRVRRKTCLRRKIHLDFAKLGRCLIFVFRVSRLRRKNRSSRINQDGSKVNKDGHQWSIGIILGWIDRSQEMNLNFVSLLITMNPSPFIRHGDFHGFSVLNSSHEFWSQPEIRLLIKIRLIINSINYRLGHLQVNQHWWTLPFHHQCPQSWHDEQTHAR